VKDVADLSLHPLTDGVAPTYELVRKMRVQALHTIGRPSTNAARSFEPMQRIPSRDVIRVRTRERLAESVV